jgi:subtilisin family serine protease
MTRQFFRWLLALGVATSMSLCCAPAMAKDAAAATPDRQILVMVNHPPDHYRPNPAYGAGYDDDLARSSRQRLAQRIARRYGLTLVDAWPMPVIGMDCFVMAVPDGRSVIAAAGQVSHDTTVAWSQPVELYKTQGSGVPPNDPLFAAEPAALQWHLAELHQIATGRGMHIAVIDSGIETNHPDLAGQIVISRNFVADKPAVAEQHGTGVAGIIAAIAGNGLGIAGVAPDARLLALRACWQVQTSPGSPTVCDSFSLAKALYFAIEQKARIINLSLTGPDDRLLRELLKAALDRGLVVVTAFDKDRADGGFPASVPGVIAVSDVVFAGTRGQVYIAPGRDVPTTQPGGRWFLVSGSSYAAAHVSGLVALALQRRPTAPLRLVSARLGSGLIDACATLVRASRCDCTCGASHFSSAGSGR